MCGGCGHGCGCHDWGYEGGYRSYYRYGRPFVPVRGTAEDVVEDLQEYKENLEAEIRRLEKRIGSLRSKSSSE